MSWSLQLRNGDLALSGNRLGQVTGAPKLVQDLRCAILEPRGTDDAHPKYGSLIDGGRDDKGNEVRSLIGESDWDLIALRIESEIRRIGSDHQQRQIERAKRDRFTYGQSTLVNDELLADIEHIDMFQAQDRLLVSVTVKTGQNQTFTIDVPISETIPVTV